MLQISVGSLRRPNYCLLPPPHAHRHATDMCDPRHAAGKRHHLSLPRQWDSFLLTSNIFVLLLRFVQRSGSTSCVYLCFTGCIKIVNLQGRLKSSRKLSAELTFNFQIESIGKKDQTWKNCLAFMFTSETKGVKITPYNEVRESTSIKKQLL